MIVLQIPTSSRRCAKELFVVSCVGFGVAFFKVELKVLRCVFTF